VRALLGLDGNALKKELLFEPALPADWPHVGIANWQIGDGTFSLDYSREETRITLRVRSAGGGGFKLFFAPALGLGTRVRGVTLNGVSLPFKLDESASAQAIRPRVELALHRDDKVEITVDPAPEIVPPDVVSRTGDLNRGLKIIRTALAGRDLKVTIEGLAGESYVLEVVNGARVDSVTGAGFDGRRLTIAIPAGKPGEFIRRDVTIRSKG
jgi:hypothetical protein